LRKNVYIDMSIEDGDAKACVLAIVEGETVGH
jgi:hypothetical protein